MEADSCVLHFFQGDPLHTFGDDTIYQDIGKPYFIIADGTDWVMSPEPTRLRYVRGGTPDTVMPWGLQAGFYSTGATAEPLEIRDVIELPHGFNLQASHDFAGARSPWAIDVQWEPAPEGEPVHLRIGFADETPDTDGPYGHYQLECTLVDDGAFRIDDPALAKIPGDWRWDITLERRRVEQIEDALGRSFTVVGQSCEFMVGSWGGLNLRRLRSPSVLHRLASYCGLYWMVDSSLTLPAI